MRYIFLILLLYGCSNEKQKCELKENQGGYIPYKEVCYEK